MATCEGGAGEDKTQEGERERERKVGRREHMCSVINRAVLFSLSVEIELGQVPIATT